MDRPVKPGDDGKVWARLAVLATLVPATAHAQSVYARVGAGYEHSSEDRLREAGGPALATGDFGGTPVGEVGLGWQAAPFVRIEALVGARPGLAFSDGAARAGVDSVSALAVGWVDLGSYGRARPFLGAGMGVARNRLGRLSIAEGGRETGRAWMAALGVAWLLSERTTLDLAYRYVDLGHVGTATSARAPVRAGLATQGINASLRWGF